MRRHVSNQLFMHLVILSIHLLNTILGLQSISRDAEDNGSHPRRLDPIMELIAYSFVLYQYCVVAHYLCCLFQGSRQTTVTIGFTKRCTWTFSIYVLETMATFLQGFVLFHNPKGIPIYFQTIENDVHIAYI